ncbi:hypothetical protein UFOVP685_35 [uncultured Caudovirales phage]|uniref:Uncharacterized protein n=1 Tax=uncultured Caudovirales phage TaxID=2100421 RepID=A0A6J5MYX2_9CAUD|nr:hypothetical protein UFOVP590_49 [uncultured Caudovirales phage]CAB4157584.1 hypothetical protein UFOVP685_35 [uncultured Caudovirales phage]CAB5225357.1 hypothetical protein UFOVP750_17 [uncultured Caudovirales phage]
MDLHAKSQQLLETLANSIHDREPNSLTPFFFNIAEVHAAEHWLKDFVKELKEDCVCI